MVLNFQVVYRQPSWGGGPAAAFTRWTGGSLHEEDWRRHHCQEVKGKLQAGTPTSRGAVPHGKPAKQKSSGASPLSMWECRSQQVISLVTEESTTLCTCYYNRGIIGNCRTVLLVFASVLYGGQSRDLQYLKLHVTFRTLRCLCNLSRLLGS